MAEKDWEDIDQGKRTTADDRRVADMTRGMANTKTQDSRGVSKETYEKDIGQSSRDTFQKRMRDTADKIAAGYNAPRSTAKKATPASRSSSTSRPARRRAAKRSAAPAEKKAPSMMNTGGESKLANLRKAPEKEPSGPTSAGGSESRPDVSSAYKSRVTGPAKKSRFRRVLGAIGRGAKAVGRYIEGPKTTTKAVSKR